MSSTTSTSKGPQSFPYDHLFKLLMIGDAAVGKVSNIYHNYCAYHIAILYLWYATQNLILCFANTLSIIICSGDKQHIIIFIFALCYIQQNI